MDWCDEATEQRDRDLAALLAKRPQIGPGREQCACGEPITVLRQQLGAVRCYDCQLEAERARR